MATNPGDMSFLPSSSNWGIPTAFDFSNSGMPNMVVFLLLFAVALLVMMHILRGNRR